MNNMNEIDVKIERAIKTHRHLGPDSQRIDIKDILTKPTVTLTTTDTGTVNSGDGTTDGVIENLRTRLTEMETALQAYKLLK